MTRFEIRRTSGGEWRLHDREADTDTYLPSFEHAIALMDLLAAGRMWVGALWA